MLKMLTQTQKQKLEEASQDDLLGIIDSCERMFCSRFHHDASDKEWVEMMQLKQDAVDVLKTKYKLDGEGIRKAWEGWNERILAREYYGSACVKCPNTPGYANYKRLGGIISCNNPYGSGGAMVYKIPKTKKECPWERDRENKSSKQK